MKTFISDIIPKFERFSKKLDDITLLKNQHWISIDDIKKSKRVFIFRDNSELIVSKDGIVEKGRWEYLGNQSLLIELGKITYLVKNSFVDNDILALKLDSSSSYIIFVSETKSNLELNTIDDILALLTAKYLTTLPPISTKFSYEIIDYKSERNIMWGDYIKYDIQIDTMMLNVFRGKNSGKYFYVDFILGKVYCEDLDDAAAKAFNSR